MLKYALAVKGLKLDNVESWTTGWQKQKNKKNNKTLPSKTALGQWKNKLFTWKKKEEIRDNHRHTDRHTHRQGSSWDNIFSPGMTEYKNWDNTENRFCER